MKRGSLCYFTVIYGDNEYNYIGSSIGYQVSEVQANGFSILHYQPKLGV